MIRPGFIGAVTLSMERCQRRDVRPEIEAQARHFGLGHGYGITHPYWFGELPLCYAKL